jgi:hypothetical protein
VEIRDVDVAGVKSLGCSIARIEAETAVMECVSAPVCRQKGQLAIADAREGLREVGELLGDEMDDVPFPLNAAAFAASWARTMPATLFRSTIARASTPSFAACANSSSQELAPRRKLKCEVHCSSI